MTRERRPAPPRRTGPLQQEPRVHRPRAVGVVGLLWSLGYTEDLVGRGRDRCGGCRSSYRLDRGGRMRQSSNRLETLMRPGRIGPGYLGRRPRLNADNTYRCAPLDLEVSKRKGGLVNVLGVVLHALDFPDFVTLGHGRRGAGNGTNTEASERPRRFARSTWGQEN